MNYLVLYTLPDIPSTPSPTTPTGFSKVPCKSNKKKHSKKYSIYSLRNFFKRHEQCQQYDYVPPQESSFTTLTTKSIMAVLRTVHYFQLSYAANLSSPSSSLWSASSSQPLPLSPSLIT